MAPKKKKGMNDDAKAKAKIDYDQYFGTELEQVQQSIDALDKEFDAEESFVDKLKSKFKKGEVAVRVMQVGPDGRLIDVSDKVNPEDLRPEDISRVQTDDGRTLDRNPQSREAALQLLRELESLPRKARNSTTESIRQMELALAESDKILEHWKK
jgi:hypothetical protein